MGTLMRHRDFLKLWFGQTVSEFGSQVTTVALPLTAAIFLRADAAQMGILGALATVPFLVMSLLAGVYIDRLPRRPLLITADVARFVLLAAIPLLWLVHRLSIVDLYVIQFLIGCMTVLFDLAYQSYLPSLISREMLVEGNGKLETTRAASQVAGPGLGSVLVQLFAAPAALAADALSYGVSVGSLLAIRTREEVPLQNTERHVWREIGEGLRFVFANRLLWSLAGCTGTSNFFSSLTGAVYVLYFIHGLHFRGAMVGVVFGVGAVGGLVGAVAASRITGKLGLGAALVSAITLSAAVQFLVPLAPAHSPVAMGMLIVAELCTFFGSVVYNINQVSLRQAITPDRLLGRMNASIRFLIWGTMPLGSLAGGLLGSWIGLHATLWVGVVGGMGAVVWLLTSPVSRLAEAPPALEAGA